MSALDLIRLVRRSLTELRDADSPTAVARIAHELAQELEAKLGPDEANSNERLPVSGEMAVCD